MRNESISCTQIIVLNHVEPHLGSETFLAPNAQVRSSEEGHKRGWGKD